MQGFDPCRVGSTPARAATSEWLATFSYVQTITTTQTKKERKRKMRRDLITRTISGTEVTVKVADPATDAITRKVITLNKAVDDKEKAKKLVSKQLDPEKEVLLVVESLTKIDKLFGITVSDFMSHAIELDPATRDAIATETVTE